MNVEQMKSNPGGHLPPDKIFGRGPLIEHLWSVLERQSLHMTAERRIGKTLIMKTMDSLGEAGWQSVYRDLERVSSVQEFAELVFDDVQQFLGVKKRAKNYIQELLEDNKTSHIEFKKRTWKQLLSAAISDLDDTETDEKFVFFWDEFPYMLQKIGMNSEEGQQVVADVLDILRSLRAEKPHFRCVLTGSIGLHHILRKLTEAKIPTSAKNDLYICEVTPLAPADGEALAKALLTGESIDCSDIDATAATLAEEVDYYPYYIHHVVAGLRSEQSTGSEKSVKEFVARQLVEASDPWQLAHYRDRLVTYYPDEKDHQLAKQILEALAVEPDHDRWYSVTEIQSSLASIDPDREDLLRLLRYLDADHYLARNNDGEYRFRFPLIRRWWKLDRGL